MKLTLKILFIFIFLFKLNVNTLAQNFIDYKYVRTYNASGQIIETAKYDEYISASVSDFVCLGHTEKILTWGLYTRFEDNWDWTVGPNYSFIQYSNGWSVWICALGIYSEYIYIKNDLSTIRMTFMAGGHGRYKEYVRAKRPTIDRLAPTR